MHSNDDDGLFLWIAGHLYGVLATTIRVSSLLLLINIGAEQNVVIHVSRELPSPLLCS